MVGCSSATARWLCKWEEDGFFDTVSVVVAALLYDLKARFSILLAFHDSVVIAGQTEIV